MYHFVCMKSHYHTDSTASCFVCKVRFDGCASTSASASACASAGKIFIQCNVVQITAASCIINLE